jgi:hypothetical protein
MLPALGWPCMLHKIDSRGSGRGAYPHSVPCDVDAERVARVVGQDERKAADGLLAGRLARGRGGGAENRRG